MENRMFSSDTASLLALVSSVLRHYGVPTPHPTLPEADRLLAVSPRNVVILLFDGMGMNVLEKHLPDNAFLRRHLITPIASVFPPTTTAATTTMETGLSPAEHGWLGWSLYFREVGEGVNLYPNTVTQSNGRKAADYHIARTVLPYRTVFDRIEETAPDVTARWVSPYSEYEAKTIPQLCDAVSALCREDGRHYIYGYHIQPDYDIHDLGTEHPKIAEHLRRINDAVEALCASLSDTLVFVTADHGLVDTAWRPLYAHPDVTECLSRAPSIETRAMSLFIKDGMHTQFVCAFTEHFGDIYTLYPREAVLARHFFGGGNIHPRTPDFIGDFLAVASGNISIDPAETPDAHPFRAAHGGMTEEERFVPLITVSC